MPPAPLAIFQWSTLFGPSRSVAITPTLPCVHCPVYVEPPLAETCFTIRFTFR